LTDGFFVFKAANLAGLHDSGVRKTKSMGFIKQLVDKQLKTKIEELCNIIDGYVILLFECGGQPANKKGPQHGCGPHIF